LPDQVNPPAWSVPSVIEQPERRADGLALTANYAGLQQRLRLTAKIGVAVFFGQFNFHGSCLARMVVCPFHVASELIGQSGIDR
jgi:hypothetical protein